MPKKVVEFKFDLFQKVNIPIIGDIGAITMCGFDETGNRYFVQTKTQGQWWHESMIEENKQYGTFKALG